MKIKNSLVLFLLFTISSIALGEYNGHHLELKIELVGGGEIHGYKYLAEVFPRDKTIAYKEFLEKNYQKVLKNQTVNDLGELTFYQNRLKYNYIDFNNEQRFIYALTDQKGINEKEIKSFIIIEMIPFSYTMGVNICNWEDKKWMHKKPVQKYSTGGLFCNHDIFIHEKNEVTDQIILELDKVYQTFEKELKAKQTELNGEDHYEIEELIENLEEGLDEKIDKVIYKFKGQKVVIVTMCTC